MKVYQINSVCGFGSTGRIALDIADTLAANGDECRIGYGRGNCADSRAFRFESDFEIKLHGSISRLTDRQGFYSTAATKRLIADIQQYDPDIIHLHNIHGYYLNADILFRFLRNYNRPVVWTLHDCWAFTGHCAYYSFAGCNRWKDGCHHCPQKKSYPASLLMDRSARNYQQKEKLFSSLPNLTIVTPSDWLRGQVSKSFLHRYPSVTIYNGIDLNVFTPKKADILEKYDLTDKKIVLGVANVWEPRKGLQDLTALSLLLPDEYQVVVVGLNGAQIEQLPKNMIGIQRTETAEELAQIYSAAHVYVNTSYEETMGLTTVEALACGTGVVVYDQTAVPEVITNECGAVVPAGDISKLKDAVCNAAFLETACIEQSKNFEKNAQYSKYIALYNTLYQR